MTAIARLSRKPWIWSWIAAFAVWFATILVTGGASTFGLSQAALTFAAFSIIVGIGQMFVITLGPGNIDLSVPATMTLAGTVALKLMDVDNGMILPGLLVAVAIGVAVGVGNYALIKALRIPPIIATLSMSFIVQSAQLAGHPEAGNLVNAPSRIVVNSLWVVAFALVLRWLTKPRLGELGWPLILAAWIAVVVTASPYIQAAGAWVYLAVWG